MLFEDPEKRARVEGVLTELIINGRVKMGAARALGVLEDYELKGLKYLSLIHISEPTRLSLVSRMPSSA